jgi:uncharacterized protein YegJ (DUF2314 family)
MRLPAVVLALCALGCERSDMRGGIVMRGPNVVSVPLDDSTLRDAIAHARTTVPDLMRRIRQPPATQTHLGVKVRLEDAGAIEHMWLYNVHARGDTLSGVLDDEPMFVHGWKKGDTVRTMPGELSDWYAVDSGRLIGGYTIRRLLREKPAAARRMDLHAMGVTNLDTLPWNER